jgi:hypothetical protein
MFKITIDDGEGEAEVIECDRYVVVGEGDGKFTKSFSHNNFVDQFGILEFAKMQVGTELAAKATRRQP